MTHFRDVAPEIRQMVNIGAACLMLAFRPAFRGFLFHDELDAAAIRKAFGLNYFEYRGWLRCLRLNGCWVEWTFEGQYYSISSPRAAYEIIRREGFTLSDLHSVLVMLRNEREMRIDGEA